MRIEVTYRLTQRAKEAIKPVEGHEITWPALNLHLIPGEGDFFSLEDLLPVEFVVAKRRFHFVNNEFLNVYIELDLYTPEDHFVRTGSVE